MERSECFSENNLIKEKEKFGNFVMSVKRLKFVDNNRPWTGYSRSNTYDRFISLRLVGDKDRRYLSYFV